VTRALASVVVVTGASSGFGRLTAELLARRGHTVFATMRELAGRNAPAAEALRELARRESLQLHPAELDVTREASVDFCVREIEERAGRIDALINNAGFGFIGLLESFSLEQAQRIFDTNVFGALRTIRAVLPLMRRRQSGLLVQVTSGAGRVVLPAMGLYCATKFALEALSECYRYELAASGIDSVCVEPGAYPTEIFGKFEAGADAEREEGYGSVRELAAKVGGTLAASTADPMEVATLLQQIVEAAPGERAARYGVGLRGPGVEAINALSAQVQEGVLAGLGVAELTKRPPRFAARTTSAVSPPASSTSEPGSGTASPAGE
jgi:NAD(P)-dependent dehydrogenase (short-subunit alcohol dehydrogenase family)